MVDSWINANEKFPERYRKCKLLTKNGKIISGYHRNFHINELGIFGYDDFPFCCCFTCCYVKNVVAWQYDDSDKLYGYEYIMEEPIPKNNIYVSTKTSRTYRFVKQED